MYFLTIPNTTWTTLMGRQIWNWQLAGLSWRNCCLSKHSNRIVVTASADNIFFQQPIALGNVVTLKSQVTPSFNSSMEVFIEVTWQKISPQIKGLQQIVPISLFGGSGIKRKAIEVPEVVPVTQAGHRQFEVRWEDEQLRLVLAKNEWKQKCRGVKEYF